MPVPDPPAASTANPAATIPSKGVDAPPPPLPEDDRPLARRAAAGDGSAFDALVDRYAPRLHAMLLHLANGDAELAAEFTQEAFVRAWTNLPSFAGASSFYTWLYRLARNRAFDLLARRRHPNLDSETVGGIAGAEARPDADLARGELQAQVRLALGRISPEGREIILLREWQGHDYDAIAGLLEIPVGTVKSRLNRARAELREALAGHVGAEDLP